MGVIDRAEEELGWNLRNSTIGEASPPKKLRSSQGNRKIGLCHGTQREIIFQEGGICSMASKATEVKKDKR